VVADETVRCYLCKESMDPYDGWCFGCQHYICDNHVGYPLGRHDADAHDNVEEDE
jgi:hypothetical protein